MQDTQGKILIEWWYIMQENLNLTWIPTVLVTALIVVLNKYCDKEPKQTIATSLVTECSLNKNTQ